MSTNPEGYMQEIIANKKNTRFCKTNSPEAPAGPPQREDHARKKHTFLQNELARGAS
jgi:hypothetical protein